MAAGFVLLAACSQAEQPVTAKSTDEPEAEAPTGTPPGDPVASSGELAGEYRLAGIDGEAFAAEFGIAISITEAAISYEPKCLGFAWTYELSDGDFKATPDPRYGPQRHADGSVTTCLPAVSQEYRELARAIDAATRAERTPQNAVQLSGGGRSVTLFSQ